MTRHPARSIPSSAVKSRDALQGVLAALSGFKKPGAAGLPITSHFSQSGKAPENLLQRLNAAFLLALAKERHPLGPGAKQTLVTASRRQKERPLARFYLDLLKSVEQELAPRLAYDRPFRTQTLKAGRFLSRSKAISDPEAIRKILWPLFFPEGLQADGSRKKAIQSLRVRRTIRMVEPCKTPITDPGREFLFTANFLVTARPGKTGAKKQDFYFDHPVPLLAPPATNELLHGLSRLNDALAFEKARGKMRQEARAVCVVSISPTHRALGTAAKKWALRELRKAPPLPHLRVFLFGEDDTRRIVRTLYRPLLKNKGQRERLKAMRAVFGVTGEYGRHYSFLKAIAALWQVAVDPRLKATFKIDLDESFLQHELYQRTGRTLFDCLTSPLFGALGRDSKGHPVRLGMVAGKLVTPIRSRERLFQSDVPWPKKAPSGEAAVFHGPLIMALSSEAETGFRYGRGNLPDGTTRVLERVHVTGGVNGIRIDALRYFRPFSPSFMGRAEDQAYLLSAWSQGSRPGLRCLHAEGVVLRHDKPLPAEKPTTASRKIGDLIRLIDFTGWAAALPPGARAAKAFMAPFTGAFISRLPVTVASLRLTLSVAEALQSGKPRLALDLARNARERLPRVLSRLTHGNAFYRQAFRRERAGWALYYDLIDRLEKGHRNADSFSVKLLRDIRAQLLKNSVA